MELEKDITVSYNGATETIFPFRFNKKSIFPMCHSRPISAGKTEYSDEIDYSLEGLRLIVSDGCFKDLCMVALLDALCRNQDRHFSPFL